MINEEAVHRIEELSDLYEQRWGKKVDYLVTPPEITQEKLVKVLERITDTGESITYLQKNIKKFALE